MSEQSLYDYGYNFIRTQMATVQGASFPLPYGGRPRQIMVDIDPKALYAQGLSAKDVVNAINAQSLIIPSGSAKIGSNEYTVAPQQPAADVSKPSTTCRIKQTNGTTVYIRDVGHVRDGYRHPDQHRAPQRQPRRAADRAEERRRVHARYRQQDQGDPAAHPLHAARRARI